MSPHVFLFQSVDIVPYHISKSKSGRPRSPSFPPPSIICYSLQVTNDAVYAVQPFTTDEHEERLEQDVQVELK